MPVGEYIKVEFTKAQLVRIREVCGDIKEMTEDHLKDYLYCDGEYDIDPHTRHDLEEDIMVLNNIIAKVGRCLCQ